MHGTRQQTTTLRWKTDLLDQLGSSARRSSLCAGSVGPSHAPVQVPGKHSRGAWRMFIQGLRGRPAADVLRSFDSDRRAKGAMHQVELGATDVPITAIVGSVGRAGDFDHKFRPRQRHLRLRLAHLERAFPDCDFPTIDLYEIQGNYYVLDGHHRVALARKRDVHYITARVVQVRPPNGDASGHAVAGKPASPSSWHPLPRTTASPAPQSGSSSPNEAISWAHRLRRTSSSRTA